MQQDRCSLTKEKESKQPRVTIISHIMEVYLVVANHEINEKVQV